MVFMCMLLSECCSICDAPSPLLNVGSAAALLIMRGSRRLRTYSNQDNDHGTTAAAVRGSGNTDLMCCEICYPPSPLLNVRSAADLLIETASRWLLTPSIQDNDHGIAAAIQGGCSMALTCCVICDSPLSLLNSGCAATLPLERAAHSLEPRQ